jgi:NAD(P)-dependent dehydrogenase (short-subunit alcohol dehydrogenase family)
MEQTATEIDATGFVFDSHDVDGADALVTSVLAPMALIEAAVPAMRDRGWGRVLNVGSVSREPVERLIVEFPGLEQAHAFYYSEEYQALGAISSKTTSASAAAIVDGAPEPTA